MIVYAPLAEYNGMQWGLYRHVWWSRHEGTSRWYPGSELTEIQRTLVDSALARGDEDQAERYLVDFGHGPKTRPEVRVSRFVPGAHYHVLDTKFDTFEAARRYAERQGYRVTGLHEVHVYAREGD